jgi:hypothetical protein
VWIEEDMKILFVPVYLSDDASKKKNKQIYARDESSLISYTLFYFDVFLLLFHTIVCLCLSFFLSFASPTRCKIVSMSVSFSYSSFSRWCSFSAFMNSLTLHFFILPS